MLERDFKTTTQVYFNEGTKKWMTRIWYVIHVNGKGEQAMKEIEASKEYTPKPRVSKLSAAEDFAAKFKDIFKNNKFNNTLGV